MVHFNCTFVFLTASSQSHLLILHFTLRRSRWTRSLQIKSSSVPFALDQGRSLSTYINQFPQLQKPSIFTCTPSFLHSSTYHFFDTTSSSSLSISLFRHFHFRTICFEPFNNSHQLIDDFIYFHQPYSASIDICAWLEQLDAPQLQRIILSI